VSPRLILPIAFRNLQRSVGFRWAVLVIALIAGVTMGVAIVVLETPRRAAGRRALLDKSAFRDVPYLLFVLGCFGVMLGMYTPFVYIQTFALDGEMVGAGLAAYLLAILNGTSIIGRIVPNMFSPRVGIMNMMIVAIVALCVTAFCLMAVKSGAGVVVAIAVYGFASGTFFASQPTIFVRLTANRAYIGTRFGMAFTVMSIALLFGPPVAGALRREFGYNGAWIWAGACLSLGVMAVSCSRGLAGGWRLKAKV
jgi:predicted MFS family arabinose efflux permease